MNAGQQYRYQKISTKLLFRDMSFNKNSPKAGQSFPDFDLLTTDGTQVKKSDYIGNKPLLLVFGSLTCPMTANAIPSLKRLYQQYGNKVDFVMLNVREAHPGERIPQPDNFGQKLSNAMELKQYFAMPWTVAIDDIDGNLHRSLDTKPNAVFLMDKNGNIVFRSIWASDEKSLETALNDLVSGKAQSKKQSSKMFIPIARAMGDYADTMDRAGKKAWREMWIFGFPIALAGTIAMLLKPLPREWRGIFSMTIIMAAMSTAVVLAWT